MHNLLEILIFTLRNFTKLPILRYLGICNVLHIWHIRAIPTYRVYRLYDIISNDITVVAWASARVNAACKGLLSTASKLSECFKAVMQTEKKLVEPNAIVSVMAYN